jgi:hypothetical protein
MNEHALPQFQRRAFLKILSLTGAGVAFAPAMTACAPSPYPTQVDRTWNTPFQMEASRIDQIGEIIRFATLAPSGHNTQPWKFQVQGNTIRILPDPSRRLAVVDPQDRELIISLGCALENLLLAAAQSGFTGEVVNFSADNPECIVITLTPAQAASDPLFDAIRRRQSTRSVYDSQPVPAADLAQLQAVRVEAGVAIQIFTPGPEMEALIQLAGAGDRVQYQDKAFVEELISWLRFNDADAVKNLDGLFSKCTGNPSVPRVVGEVFVRLGRPDETAKADENKLRSSSGIAVFTTPGDERQDWVNSGRAFERFALTATHLNLAVALMNQPLEVASLRSQLQTVLKLDAAFPQMMVRFGYAAEMPRSLRRSVEQVLASAE